MKLFSVHEQLKNLVFYIVFCESSIAPFELHISILSLLRITSYLWLLVMTSIIKIQTCLAKLFSGNKTLRWSHCYIVFFCQSSKAPFYLDLDISISILSRDISNDMYCVFFLCQLSLKWTMHGKMIYWTPNTGIYIDYCQSYIAPFDLNIWLLSISHILLWLILMPSNILIRPYIAK